MEKAELRKIMKEKLHTQSIEDIKKKSGLIEKKLFSLNEFLSAKTVALYISKFYEVDTFFILKNIPKEKKTAVPVMSGERMKFAEFTGLTNLARGKFGVFEPKKRRYTEDKFDLIVIPGIAYDFNRHRLGHGKGFYDRFLKNHEESFKVGLAFDFQIVREIPCEPHDIHMDMVITEKRII
ncbi:5-formyltetrahydrofolate cyclo-ligase [Candidatus Micrarchaeota archaeon]|nr:5-formyltetrahydrofolate cyclo-ligase [Candidatus Micrarchaeota archaeon]